MDALRESRRITQFQCPKLSETSHPHKRQWKRQKTAVVLLHRVTHSDCDTNRRVEDVENSIRTYVLKFPGMAQRQRLEPMPLCQTALWRCLELLDHSDIPESSQVIIGAARNAEGVAKLEPKLLGRVLTEYIVHSQGDGGVVQDVLPARHTVNSRRRHFLALFAADDFLTAFRIPRHRRRFHWRGEDQAVGELRVCEPGRMHPVLLPDGLTGGPIHIPKLLRLDLFPEPVIHVHGHVEINVVPRPVKVGNSLPFDPSIAAGHVPEKAAFKRTIVSAPGPRPRFGAGELVNERIQITYPGQPGKGAIASLYCVLNAKVSAARVLAATA